MTKPTIQLVHKEHYQFDFNQNMIVVQQFSKMLKEWKFMSYRCRHCDMNLKSMSGAYRHLNNCKELNTIKKRETIVPIQVITKNGQRMYRYGDTGKLYPTRADAEKQAAAIMASGYKEPINKMKDMTKK